jgi:hypothetical protein
VIGATGSGKTALSRHISEAWGLPLFELDRVFWDAGTQGAQDIQFIESVSALAQQDAWVLDGHYRSVRELIWRRSEMIVWLNYPLWIVGFRLARRFLQKRLSTRDQQKSGKDAAPSALSGPAEHSATWRVRMGRLARTIGERKEYGQLLGAPEYQGIEVVELRSAREGEALIMSRRSALRR